MTPETAALPKMLTVAKVAAMLSVSTRWVRVRCGSGEIHAVRLAGDGPWRIFPDGLAKILGEKHPRPVQRDRSAAIRSMVRQGLTPSPISGGQNVPQNETALSKWSK
jgi:hypothetical protein